MNEKSGESTPKQTTGPGFPLIYGTYYALLVLMLAASFFPQYRVWGFNHWAYYPVYVAIAIFCLGAALPFTLKREGCGHEESPASSQQPVGRGRFVVMAAILVAVYLAAFYFLQARTHYLGDGYQLLANLPTVNPWIKLRNLGEELIHKAVYGWLSGEESARSLKSFQLVSHVSGFVFLLSIAFAAKSLFAQLRERLLFLIGVATGGYMLLFFGYVENYSVFVTCVTIYAVAGLLVLSGRLKCWYVLIPMVLAMLMHALGVALILPTAYLLITGTSIGTWLSGRSLRFKIILSVIVLKLCLLGFWYLYTEVIFFRASLVPFSDGPFTLEGYTLFSLNHVLDIINLCYMLLPAFPILVAIAIWAVFKQSAIRRETIFLGVMTLSALMAAVLFDPKLGMPRDWDLFSFCGVPAAILGYYTLLKAGLPSPGCMRVASLAIFLGLAVLVPRAVGRALGYIEVSHVENYIRHDVKKNKNINPLLRNYYTERGDHERAAALFEQWQTDFPERSLNERGLKLRNEGQYAEAIRFFQGALSHNPTHVPTYAVLASCYRELEKYDTARAVLEIANGMDPNNTSVLAELAYLYRQCGDLAEAEKYFKRVLSIDPSNLYASLGLLEVLWTTGQHTKHDELLIRAAGLPKVPAGIHMRLGGKYLSDSLYDKAEDQFRQAISKGVDPQRLQGVLDSLARLKQ